MKIRKTLIVFISSLLLFFLSLSILFFFFKTINNKKIHTVAVLENLESKIIQKNDINSLMQKTKEIDSIKESMNSHFVDSSKINIFVDGLEKLGENNNTDLKVKDVAISTVNKNTILVRISINGSFSNLIKTIELLENDTYQIHITNLFLNRKTAPDVLDAKGKIIKSSDSQWQADLSFNVLAL